MPVTHKAPCRAQHKAALGTLPTGLDFREGGSVPAFRGLSAVGTGEKGIKASSRSGEKKQEWNH